MITHNWRLGLLLAGIGTVLAGCAGLGPNYSRPLTELPTAWSGSAPQDTLPPDERWWTAFDDGVLTRLVDEAVAHNNDLAMAMARVDEARALLGITRAQQFPEIDIVGSRSRRRDSELRAEALPLGSPREHDVHSVSLEVAYEADLWGRYRQSTAAARAQLLATVAARDAVRLTVTTLVAQGYFGLIALDEQVLIARRTLETRRESLDLQRLRVQLGANSELDLRQTEAELAAAQALLPDLERARVQQQNGLAVLLGRSPRAIVEGSIERAAALMQPPIAVPAGLPSDLLERRPDIRQAEQDMIAAHARVAGARAAYFPSIALTGAVGSESAALADLFSNAANGWQLGASLFQPIFNAGRIRSGVDAARARERHAVAQYRLTVQNAFREVQDALAAQRRSRERFIAEASRSLALQDAQRLARLRYDSGQASWLEVLDAERSRLAAELNRVDALRAQRTAIADLVKALGGGWTHMHFEPT